MNLLIFKRTLVNKQIFKTKKYTGQTRHKVMGKFLGDTVYRFKNNRMTVQST